MAASESERNFLRSADESARVPGLLLSASWLFLPVMHPAVSLHRKELTVLCRRFHVRRLALFGSAARGDYDPNLSDVDLLVEFEDTASRGYADRYLDFALAAEHLLGRPVDLVTTRSVVSPGFQRKLERDAIELYAA